MVVASATLLVGCSSGDGPPEHAGQRSLEASSSATDLLAGRVLPIFAYATSGEESATTRRAHAIVVNDCLAEFGFEPIPARAEVPPLPAMYRRYGVTDPAVAAEYGFHEDAIGQANTPDLDAPPPSWTSNGPMMLVLSGGRAGAEGPNANEVDPDQVRTYAGKEIPFEGCMGEANRALDAAGVDHEDLQLAEALQIEAYHLAEVDPRVVEVTEQWSSCMSAKGHHLPDPFEHAFDIEGPISEAERAAAIADVECKAEAGYVDTWFEVEAEYGDRLIQENFEALTEARAAIEANNAKALEVISAADDE